MKHYFPGNIFFHPEKDKDERKGIPGECKTLFLQPIASDLVFLFDIQINK